VAEALEVGDGAIAFYIRRLLLADDEPIGMLESWLAPWIFAEGRKPAPDELDAGSLYAWLARFSVPRIAGARECIDGALADAAMARRLSWSSGAARTPRTSGPWNTRSCITAPTDIALSSSSLETALLNRHNDHSCPDERHAQHSASGAAAEIQCARKALSRPETDYRRHSFAALPSAPRYDGQPTSEIYADAERTRRRFRKAALMASSSKM
jgi:UTRA domain